MLGARIGAFSVGGVLVTLAVVDPDQMFSLVLEGALQGMVMMLAGLWAYALSHPWVWFFVLGVVALKALEIGVRRRRPRRR